MFWKLENLKDFFPCYQQMIQIDKIETTSLKTNKKKENKNKEK